MFNAALSEYLKPFRKLVKSIVSELQARPMNSTASMDSNPRYLSI